ncbi:hypothetical protein DO97_02015 [Neosynechococcus sphagnicola sy1]|uniref:Uncharacterized protein n=1 Tax=Neosynechococcus sphagnicola sy1 TaxID=1497020 RepID=A0A098TLE1_9CYAN|nr:hypothetical protein [Neosynechococcus sphagnicola]KGF73130.1 hypothetical protein DO97_02015 [Neosynechococcus sphagnicola sy1]
MNLRRIVSSTVVGLAVPLVVGAVPPLAHAQPPDSLTLSDLTCTRVGIGDYWHVAQPISIGRQYYDTVAYMGRSLDYGLRQSEVAEVVCNLNSIGSAPPLKTLTLTVGLQDGDFHVDEVTSILVSIYRDGKIYQTKPVMSGRPVQWLVDLQNVESIAVTSQCATPAVNSPYCPNLYILTDSLTR